jgi:hypothetical protein
MRDMGLALLLIVFLASGAYLYMRWHGGTASIQQILTGSDTGEANRKLETPKEALLPPKPSPRDRKARAIKTPPVSVESSPMVLEQTGPGKADVFIDAADIRNTSARLTSYPFPGAGDLNRSMPRAQLLARFGTPNLTTSTIMKGNLLENYFYVKPDRSAMTVTTLKNGAIASVYTTRP